MEFIYEIQRRFPDFDGQQIVNNAVISTYFESIYIEFVLQKIDSTLDYKDFPITLCSETTKFLIGIDPKSRVIGKLTVTEIRPTNFTVLIELVDPAMKEKVFTRGTRQLAYIHPGSRRPKAMPEDVTDRLKKFLNII